MAVLHVTRKDGERRLPFAPGPSGRELLDISHMTMHSAGGTVGASGLGRIHIKAGTGGKTTANEQINLSPDQMQRGTHGKIRLFIRY